MEKLEEESDPQKVQDSFPNSINEDIENLGSHNRDSVTSAKNKGTRRYGHQYRMNPNTFRDFSMRIWNKHEDRTKRCVDELIYKLEDLGYEKNIL